MSEFEYTKEENDRNRVLKDNLRRSETMLNDTSVRDLRNDADANIAASEKILQRLGCVSEVAAAKRQAKECAAKSKMQHKPVVENWETIVHEASKYTPEKVGMEDILTAGEIDNAYKMRDEIYREFSKQTSIINKTDLSFLAIATGLQVVKSLLFPYVAKKYGYGESFDHKKRLTHNDKSIEDAHRKANDKFKETFSDHKNGYWQNILYQTPPYDITTGSSALGLNIGGKYHRLYTLGHDPVLGWFFGTANILTDIITLTTLESYRVIRKPKMMITPQKVSILIMLQESYQVAKADYLNLPAAVFAQAQHLKSDVNTKVGLPIPIISTVFKNFAGELYKNQYDALCAARDIKIVGVSYIVSMIFDIVIGLAHGLYRTDDVPQKIYEARTRKILLVSNAIASTSTILNTCITKNPKNLDIGSLLSTIGHLFTDLRFIAKLEQEFVENEIGKKLQAEFDEIDRLYDSL